MCVCMCVCVCVCDVCVCEYAAMFGYDAATCKGARARVRDRACPGHPETLLKLAVLLLSESCPPPAPHPSTSAWPKEWPTA